MVSLEKYFSLSDDVGGGKIKHEILNMLSINLANRKQKHETANCLEFVHITKLVELQLSLWLQLPMGMGSMSQNRA